MLNIKYNRSFYILLSIMIFVIDQITKYLISIDYNNIINKDLILFNIDYVKNYGAAFNFLSGSRIFLSFISIFFTFLLLYFILNNKNNNNIDLLGYSFILGGTIGNGFDRVIKGYVIDFINLNFINFPVFNIADICINIGFLFIIYSFIKYKG